MLVGTLLSKSLTASLRTVGLLRWVIRDDVNSFLENTIRNAK